MGQLFGGRRALAHGEQDGDRGHGGGGDGHRDAAPAARAREYEVAGERGEQRVHRRVTLGRIDREAADQGVVDERRHVARRGLDELTGAHAVGEVEQVVAGERLLLVQRGPQGDAEAELVGARVGGLAAVLLRRHVRRRAHDRAGHRQRGAEGVVPADAEGDAVADALGGRARLLAGGPGEAEVGHARARRCR
ncbi:hypothetical protein [Nannocystis pusilla]|uniref:hypothetical protein n=1 Tax=Nannocystis pusilla TaxID=889268 RepID=UPI003B7F9181